MNKQTDTNRHTYKHSVKIFAVIDFKVKKVQYNEMDHNNSIITYILMVSIHSHETKVSNFEFDLKCVRIDYFPLCNASVYSQ